VQIVAQHGDGELATLYVAQLTDGSRIEFVESVQPPVPRHEKWVHVISTLKGCPFDCTICDAGGNYAGKLSSAEIVDQVDYLVRTLYPDGVPLTRRLKVQFARMGDPALNAGVLDALVTLEGRYSGLLFPSISTIAPATGSVMLEDLLDLKNRLFGPRFQMQFSLHTTDEVRRRELVPARTWSFAEMGDYGRRFHRPGERKVTLNFATPVGFPLDATVLLENFSPDHFVVKLTPVNPTSKVIARGLTGRIDPEQADECKKLVQRFEAAGYGTILSIGELEENQIGSNCGMFVSRVEHSREAAC
jgi:23S rRNA (adenine2503-C2)-methyltransferase